MAGLEEGQPLKCEESEDLKKLNFNDKVARAFKDNRPILVLHLRCSEFVDRMNEIVDGFDSEFRSKVRETDRKQGTKEANELFLERLETSADQGKWRSFMNVLNQLEYEMIYKLLIGEPITRNRERYVKLVDILTPFIKSHIDPLQLIDVLLTEGCLNDQDKQNIQQEVKNHGNIDGTLLLLSRITRLKDDWFRGFMTALYQNNQITLMREIDPDFTNKFELSKNEELITSRMNLHEESNPRFKEKGETETAFADVSPAIPIAETSTDTPDELKMLDRIFEQFPQPNADLPNPSIQKKAEKLKKKGFEFSEALKSYTQAINPYHRSEKKSERMEKRLFRQIGEELHRDSRDFKDFVHAIPLFPRDKCANDSSVEKLLETWAIRGGIGLGNYDNLIQLLIDARLEKIHEMAKPQIEEIKRQLKVEEHEADSPADIYSD